MAIVICDFQFQIAVWHHRLTSLIFGLPPVLETVQICIHLFRAPNSGALMKQMQNRGYCWTWDISIM